MSEATTPRRLLFLPGALGSGDFWEPLARELRFKADRSFITYPGFAAPQSDPSITGIEQLIDRVVLGIDCPTAVIAQSMGGVLAIKAALRKPTLITHLVLIATSGGLDTSALGGRLASGLPKRSSGSSRLVHLLQFRSDS